MKFHLIYPSWNKLEGQTHFNLPPHGPVVMAATIPENVEIIFTDENVDKLVYYEETNYINNAIAREKQLKGWLREKKIALIESFNPSWEDLSKGWYT